MFISYSHDNCTLQVVDNDLKPQLTQEGLRVFIDRGSIKPGDIWPAEIASAIHTCKAFVVVLTKRYVSSVYCNGELYEAEALDKRLFPVVCETGWEEETGGRPVADIVRAVQSVSLVTEHKETELARLVKAIKGKTIAALKQITVHHALFHRCSAHISSSSSKHPAHTSQPS